MKTPKQIVIERIQQCLEFMVNSNAQTRSNWRVLPDDVRDVLGKLSINDLRKLHDWLDEMRSMMREDMKP